jgi:hypothetical protein
MARRPARGQAACLLSVGNAAGVPPDGGAQQAGIGAVRLKVGDMTVTNFAGLLLDAFTGTPATRPSDVGHDVVGPRNPAADRRSAPPSTW